MTQTLLVEQQNRICTLTLNRPESLNALNHELFQQLRKAVDDIASAGDDIGCVILRGNGKAFSAGHDLKDIATGTELDHSDYEATTLEALASLPVPVIAQVHRYCFTGALELALATDLIFVSDDTVLADTHSQWGLSPVWGMTQRLPRRIGVAKAKDMMFSSRKVGAAEALAMGLVDRVCKPESLGDEVLAYAQSVVRNSGDSHRICKSILEATDGLRIHDGLDYEYTNSPGACADMAERVARFTERK
ncbi:enoyl-CoA hydratase/isomerase family protein [Pseudomaricurvus alkylphenolicus]|jgi:enoyl-CoA hydratase/carnithine racemase|uniref:enoyl-CoA hydratase/isomerase family protein n=1 Tax=Pseudomaricurvus alkylphenolicus TaxID=1306991 RepID=UPI00142033BD|nr:enoyl-CoA hydratase/isomerase family protein [Pseudomaricurvus alkylphenolicus]NIB41566.1 enoyl-CoA hydratase/isomerase family protein [Pseudomaricurvus alkylphenolicus]